MIHELEKLLKENRVLFLISGQSLKNIQKRVVNHIRKKLRKKIIIGTCSGAEVWGFNKYGNLLTRPYYSFYEKKLSQSQKLKWRQAIQGLIKEFKLEVYPTMPTPEFKKKAGENSLAIMCEDRGPQITFEVVNGRDLEGYDLRIPILKRAKMLFEKYNLPITPRLAGVFAIDFAIKGVSKRTAVKYVIKHDLILSSLGLNRSDLQIKENVEVWGDKFSITKGGTDRHISEALPKKVRSITFREENRKEFPKGYSIVVWNGKKHLQEGLLEFLILRRNSFG